MLKNTKMSLRKMQFFSSKTFVFIIALVIGIDLSLTFDFAGFFKSEATGATTGDGVIGATTGDGVTDATTGGGATGAIFYFSLGALVGVASLLWNIFNESKNYALRSYDNFVSKPVTAALAIFDELFTSIERVVYTNHKNKKIIDDLNTILNESAKAKIAKAERLCEEADKYMKETNHDSEFQKKLFNREDYKTTEDLLINFLEDAVEDSITIEQRRNLLRKVKYEFIQIVGGVRVEITGRSKQISRLI